MAKTRTVDEHELLDKLIERVADVLKETEIHPRDLASVGNLVMKIVDRKDQLEQREAEQKGDNDKVVPMPAMPPIKLATEFDKAMARTEKKRAGKRA